MRIRALVGVTLCALACTARPASDADSVQATPGGSAVADGELRLERTACFHSCPEYSVSIAANGDVRFRGLRNVAATGEHSATIPVASAAAVFRFADSVRVDSLSGQYTHGTRGCEPYVADFPGVIVTLVRASGGARIEGDPGCPSMPKALLSLAGMIDSVAGVGKWVARP